MLFIYTERITDRIQYIMQYVFEERLGIQFFITDKLEQFSAVTGALRIAYATEGIDNALFFFAQPLLFENDIKKIELREGVTDQTTVLFTHDHKAALSFDVFAAIFYLISRYEEYLNDPKDKHGNYNCSNSILVKLKVSHIPVADQWINLLKEVLIKNFPAIKFKKHSPKFGLSFDIDVAYQYKNRSIARTGAGFFKKVLTGSFKELKNQLLVLLNKKEDAFDTYSYIFNTLKNKKAVFFFDMGLYGKFDKNPSFRNKRFRTLIKYISYKAIIGLHPSYASNKNNNLIAIEKNKLEQITNRPISISRQHYLKLKLPYTYNNLLKNNIIEDYTMGYSGDYGFRAGTCHSFLFFDLEKNCVTNLRLYPFAYMDVSLNNYLKLDIDDAKKIVSEVIDVIQKHDGIFIPIWHNSTLCNCNEWKGWREVLEHTIIEIDSRNFENLFD